MSGHEHERLSAYLDGELSPAEMAAVAAHVAACPDCALRLAELGMVDEAAAAHSSEAPRGYFDSFPSRVAARLGPTTAARRLPAWTWAAAAALLLAVVTPLTLWQRPASEPSEAALEMRPAAPPAPANAPAPLRASEPVHAEQKPMLEPRRSVGALATPAPDARASNAASGRSPQKREPGFAAAPREADARTPGAPADVGEARSLGAVAGRVDAPEPVAAARDEGPALAAGEAAAGTGLLGSRARHQANDLPVDLAPPAALDAMAEAEAPAQPKAAAPGRVARPMAGTLVTQSAPGSEAEWRRLEAVRPATADEWRRLREALRRFALAAPQGPHADQARVRTIESGFEAWRAGADPADEELFRRDATAYLEREDAKQKERVRGLLR